MSNTRGRIARRCARLVYAGLLGGPLLLPACSSSDTVVALNVTATEALGPVDTLQVGIAQRGRAKVERSIDPPKQPTDAGETIEPMFFERITLPSGFRRAPATIEVRALAANGDELDKVETSVGIRPKGAVAVYVTLGEAPSTSADAGTDASLADAEIDASLADAGAEEDAGN